MEVQGWRDGDAGVQRLGASACPAVRRAARDVCRLAWADRVAVTVEHDGELARENVELLGLAAVAVRDGDAAAGRRDQLSHVHVGVGVQHTRPFCGEWVVKHGACGMQHR